MNKRLKKLRLIINYVDIVSAISAGLIPAKIKNIVSVKFSGVVRERKE